MPAATIAPRALKIWLSSALPQGLTNSFQLPVGMEQTSARQEADLRIEPGQDHPLSSWIYALVAPFPTLTDEVTLAALKQLWLKGSPLGDEGKALLVDESSAAVFTALWGQPSAVVATVPPGQMVDVAWKDRSTWAIVPFEQLEPRWKVLLVDGQSPVRKEFDPQKYALQAVFSLNGAQDLVEKTVALSTELVAPTNRRSDRLTTVVLTGTTSLVRATAGLMEMYGMDYPAKDIGGWLRDADILHISNEVAFAKNCPSPLPHSGLLFCSQERYIQLLETIGTDVVDLSGDHLNDWGPEALLNSIELYHQRGWQTYGGGINLNAGRQPAVFEHNGNKIAFIGCNYKQIGYASASQTAPGAVHCDPAWLYPAIQKLKDAGYLPIVTFQDDEYMEAIARPKLKEDFYSAVDAGGVIISGTQSHQPQALDFKAGFFIHYGLGNLFFDQIHSWETTDQAFIDRHVIYNGKHISTELLSTIFVDFARPRAMTPEERRKLLKLVFKASGW
jgi:poly-gamma-glutamate synthesis protein (capsule biosynthesis protein)